MRNPKFWQALREVKQSVQELQNLPKERTIQINDNGHVYPERLSDLLVPLFKENLQVDSTNQTEQTPSNMEQHLTPAQFINELQSQAEPIEQIPLKFEGEPPKRYRVLNENGLWVIEEKSSGRRNTLMMGDWVEFYNGTEAHGSNGEFVSTTSGRVIDMDSMQLHIKYRNFRFLMSSGTEVYNYQPQVAQWPVEKSNNNYIVYVFLIVLLICGTITTLALTGWF